MTPQTNEFDGMHNAISLLVSLLGAIFAAVLRFFCSVRSRLSSARHLPIQINFSFRSRLAIMTACLSVRLVWAAFMYSLLALSYSRPGRCETIVRTHSSSILFQPSSVYIHTYPQVS